MCSAKSEGEGADMAKNQQDFFKKKNEWSVIKDKLLQGYLPQYFQKLLTSGRPIYYVDCFAGKGKFDDGQLGSPLIALNAINECIRVSKAPLKRDSIQSCFIELNHAADLRHNLDLLPYSSGAPNVVSGKFEENICGLLENKCGYHVFLYIDPYGIRALDSQLFDKFESYGFRSFEMLINFNSFGFFRDACRVMRVDTSQDDALKDLDDLVEYEPTKVTPSKQSEDLLTRIAGNDFWKAIVTDFQSGIIDGYQAEKRLSTEYKQHLKKRYRYVLDMPIRLKPGQRPKYRMIHVSDHEDGCFLMAANMQRRKDELFLNIQQNGQMSLLDIMPSLTSTVEGEILTEEEIEQKVLAHICNMKTDMRITVFLARFCNEYGLICPFKMIYEILERLEGTGKVKIIRQPALKKNGERRTFWEEKGSQTVTIRRHM